MKGSFKKLLFIPPLILGVAVLVIAVKSKDKPERMPPAERITVVRTIEAPSVTVIPRALGYGSVEPGRVWQAVAEVGGKVVETHPQLKKGAILEAGVVLLRIDPTDYRLAVSETKANIRAVRGQLAELAAKEKNTRLSLKIDERSLQLSRNDLERKRQLLKRKNASQAAVDQEERNVLARRQAIQSLANTLNLIPAEREVLRAQLALQEAHLKSAERDLERTTVIAPFDCRIAEVNVEETQFAAQGKVLVVADSIDVAEVDAQVPIGRLISLIPTDTEIPDHVAQAMSDLPSLLAFSAVVRLRGGEVEAQWPARFTRVSDAVDPETRTIGIIVAVDEPYGKAVPGVRPPLSKNMFVEVELSGKPRPAQVVVPRAALHDGRLYVAGADGRLDIRDVVVAFAQTNFAVIAEGLAAGERVVVSDLIPAISGMLLESADDETVARALVAEAGGEGTVR